MSVVLVAVVALGCVAPSAITEPAEVASATAKPETMKPPADAPATPAKLAEPCASLDAAFQKERQAGGQCTKAADCACYPDLRIDGVRGTSDKVTAKKLARFSNQYRSSRCPTIFAHGPPPMACAPTCQDGRCQLPSTQ